MPPRRFEDSSSHFFGVLVVLGLSSFVLILVLAGFGLRRSHQHQVFREAQRDAVQIARGILHVEGYHFLEEKGPGAWQVRLDADAIAELDFRLRRFLNFYEIRKIKIFDSDSRIVYSTDASIIGRLNKENPRLARSLAGQVDSALKRKDSLVDLAEEQRFDLDVVETYVPIFTKEGQVIGSIELYKDVTHYRRAISSLIWENIAILAIVLLLVSIPVMLILRILTRRLSIVQFQLKKQASIDALTGVLSRREILAQAKTAGLGLPHTDKHRDIERSNGIMMLDIDRFKQVNDMHGHLVGDLVLKIVASRLSTGIRRQDLVGRFGGEEFLLVVPGSSLERTCDLAERIRKSIADAPFSCEGKCLEMTVSIGVSCYPPGDEPHFLRALDDADKGLYHAKNSGRNQVCLGPHAQAQSKSPQVSSG